MGSCDLSDIDAPEEIDANDSEGEEEDVLVESEAEEECKEEGGGGQDARGRRMHTLLVPSDEVLSKLCADIKPCVQSGPTKVHTMLHYAVHGVCICCWRPKGRTAQRKRADHQAKTDPWKENVRLVRGWHHPMAMDRTGLSLSL